MKNKPIVVVAILCILLLLGWAVTHYFFSEVPPMELPSPEPITTTPSSTNGTTNSGQEWKPAVQPSTEKASEEQSISSQRISYDKITPMEDNSVDLSQYTMSIKKKESKGYEIMPGVNVKSRAIHIQLDQQNSKSIEMERKPSNSNNEYQLMLKKKF